MNATSTFVRRETVAAMEDLIGTPHGSVRYQLRPLPCRINRCSRKIAEMDVRIIRFSGIRWAFGTARIDDAKLFLRHSPAGLRIGKTGAPKMTWESSRAGTITCYSRGLSADTSVEVSCPRSSGSDRDGIIITASSPAARFRSAGSWDFYSDFLNQDGYEYLPVKGLAGVRPSFLEGLGLSLGSGAVAYEAIAIASFLAVSADGG